METKYLDVNLGKEIAKQRLKPIPRYKIKNKIQAFLDSSSYLKRVMVSKFFWGRGSYYKNTLHVLLIGISLVVLFGGVANNFASLSAPDSFSNDVLVVGQADLLQQGGSVEAALVQRTVSNISSTFYQAKAGEKISVIAEQYGVDTDTVRWANRSNSAVLFGDTLAEDTELEIPSINGKFYTVNSNDTLESIIASERQTNPEANEFSIIELNSLSEPYTLEAGDRLFIPGGNNQAVTAIGSLDIPTGVFADPLAHAECAGYSYSRGYLSYHDGVDLARWPGCPIQSIANGIVIYAGWASGGQGYMVSIDHGGGIVSKYFHGDGTYWVKTGDRVSINQPIMRMGTTGFSTGVHLHFSLWKDGYTIDPAPYVPYLRPDWAN